MRFAANVGFLFTERPYLERFAAARAAGLGAVEMAWPTASHDDVRAAVEEAGCEVALLNVDAGDLAAGERGWACDPRLTDRWRRALDAALHLAWELDCPTLNVLAGNVPTDADRREALATLDANLRWAAARVDAARRRLVVELLNPRDTPRYLITDLRTAADLLSRHPGLALQLDTYHVASIGADPTQVWRQLGPRVGHVQLADHPGRHEPGTGQLDLAGFLGALRRDGYGGAIGLEYVPSSDTLASLAWLHEGDAGEDRVQFGTWPVPDPRPQRVRRRRPAS